MTDEIKPATEELKPDQPLAVLKDLMNSGESETSRINAAKILLQQITSQKDDKDDEAQKHEAEERARAISEAHRLLDELADIKHQSNRLTREMAASGEAEPDNATG